MSSTVSKSQVFVTDTSALIEDPEIFNKLTGRIVIPLSVIKQLDLQKNSKDEFIARTTRRISRYLDDISAKGNIATGIQINDRTVVNVLESYDRIDILDSAADNKIVGTAKRLKRETGQPIVLLATDKNMRVTARSLGIDAGFTEYLNHAETVNEDTVSPKWYDVYLDNRKPIPKIEPKNWSEEISKALVNSLKFMGAMLAIYLVLLLVALASQIK